MKGGITMKEAMFKFLIDILMSVIKSVVIDYIRSRIKRLSDKETSAEDEI